MDELEPRPPEPEAEISYLSPVAGGFTPAAIRSSYGDLAFCARILDDYARLCEAYGERTEDAYYAEWYATIAKRCRKVSDKWARAIGLDKEAAARRCARRQTKAEADVGEDGLTQMVQRDARKAALAKKEDDQR